MARVLFLIWDGGGNRPPAIGIAQEPRAHGHEVVFAGYAAHAAQRPPPAPVQ